MRSVSKTWRYHIGKRIQDLLEYGSRPMKATPLKELNRMVVQPNALFVTKFQHCFLVCFLVFSPFFASGQVVRFVGSVHKRLFPQKMSNALDPASPTAWTNIYNKIGRPQRFFFTPQSQRERMLITINQAKVLLLCMASYSPVHDRNKLYPIIVNSVFSVFKASFVITALRSKEMMHSRNGNSRNQRNSWHIPISIMVEDDQNRYRTRVQAIDWHLSGIPRRPQQPKGHRTHRSRRRAGADI